MTSFGSMTRFRFWSGPRKSGPDNHLLIVAARASGGGGQSSSADGEVGMRAHIVKMQRSQTEMGRPDWMQPTLYDRSFKVASSTYKPDKYPIGGYPRKRSKARVPDLDTIMPATKAHTRSVDALSSRHQEALDAPTSSFASFGWPVSSPFKLEGSSRRVVRS